MNSKSITLLVPVLMFISSCDTKPFAEPEKLLSELKKVSKKVDSLVIDKDLPLNPDHHDSLHLEKFWTHKITETLVPVSSSNQDDHSRDQVMQRVNDGVSASVQPKTFTVEPFVVHAGLPKPVKAGDLRSTGLSNENVFYLNEEQGMPSGAITDVKADPQGFLWIASNGGLTRYDGYNFYTYNGRNGLQVSAINEILLDKDSTLWIASRNGLIHFTGNTFYVYNKESGLPGDNVTDIAFDRDQHLWFACIEKGVGKLSKNSMTIYDESSKLPLNGLHKLTVDSANTVVIGYWGAGCKLLRKDNTLFSFKDVYNYSTEAVTSLYSDKRGGIWTGSYGIAFCKWGPTHNTRCQVRTGVAYYIGSAFLEDSKGHMWLCTGEGGLAKMTDDGYTIYTTKQGLTSNKITCITEDSNHNIWVGTQDGGLNRITPGSFRSYSASDGLSDKNIASLCMTKRGILLIGTWADDLFAFNGKYFKRISGIGLRIHLSIAEDKYENLLVGTHQHGFEYFIKSKTDSLMYDSARNLSGLINFNNPMVVRSFAANDGSFWTANSNGYGVTRYKYDSFETYFIKNGLANNSALSVVGDKKGNIWLANDGCGISRIKDGKITHYTKKNGLVANEALSLHVDKNDNLWIGTGAGLSLYNGKSFVNFELKDGLSNTSILSILEDKKNRIWVSTNKGINVLLPDKTQPKGYKIENYLIQDGLKSNGFALGAAAYDSVRNVMYWGSSTGLLKLDLNEFDVKRESPACHLAQISLMGEFVNFSALKDSMAVNKKLLNKDSSIIWNDLKFSGITPFYNVPQDLVLPYDINNVTINFYAYSGNPTHRIKYRYRLKGSNEKWEEVALPEAKFSNLDAGVYEFEAQAKMEGQEWGQACNFKFEITPPYWLTWWFKIAMLASVIGIIIYIFKARNRQLLQRQELLERTVEERTREINVQKMLIEEKQKEILDSINYAKRIQYALLAHSDLLKQHLKEHFIFFKPKDIVSGDFYWATTAESGGVERFYLAVCDSTGHGVPGAFMSLLSIGFLNEAIKEKGMVKPNEVFDYVRMRLVENISKEGQKDGFDGILVCFEKNKTTDELPRITFAAANNEPVVIRNGALMSLGRDRMPVGMGERKEAFRIFEYAPMAGDQMYLYTDGFADQFGGPKGKKLMYKRLNEKLLSVYHLPMEEQKTDLHVMFNEWKGNLEQVDDVCIIGVRL